MTGRSALAGLAAVVVVLLAASSSAQETTGSGGFLRVQWHVTELREPVHVKLEGYVYNASPIRVTDVRLHVVERDRAAQAVGEAWGWVFGDVPARGSAHWRVTSLSVGSRSADQPPPSALIRSTLAPSRRPVIPTAVCSLVSAAVCAITTFR